jgi:copper chaperone CopZ
MNSKCHVEPIQKKPTVEEQRNTKAVLLSLWGVECSNCANRVRNSLLLLKGVLDVYVDHIDGQARVVFNPDLVTIAELISAVASAGGDGVHEYQAEIEAVKGIP